jgi:4-hydroxy-2-oxoheptanedioate aldolase
MTVRQNRIKERLQSGATVLLSFIRLPEPGLAEILGYAGLDGVIIDMEHGGIGWTEAERMILTAYAADITPLIRIPKNDPQLVSRALDIGALGIIAPHIRSEAEARQLRDSALYPPRGHRSIGIGRPAKWSAIGTAEYFKTMNAQILIGAMIEDERAVDELDAIAELGLDLLLLGTADLSASLGELGASTQPQVMAIGDRLVTAGRRHGVAVGFPCRSRESAREAIQRGYRAIAFTVETLLLQHVRDLALAVGAESDLLNRKA